jgi:hypothetical protein
MAGVAYNGWHRVSEKGLAIACLDLALQTQARSWRVEF